MIGTRRFWKTLSVAGVAFLALAGQAAAGDLFGAREGSIKDEPAAAAGRTLSWSFNVGANTDYIFRGLSLSNEDPTVFGGIDASYGIFYIGAWGTSLENGQPELGGDLFGPTEIDLYAGIKPVWGPVTFDFGVIYYAYPSDEQDLDYTELKAGVSITPVTNLSLGTTLYYAPDQSNSPEVFTVENSAGYTFAAIGPVTPTLSGIYGFADATDLDTYTYWNVGLALAWEKFTFDVRYWDTDGVGDQGFFDTDLVAGRTDASDSRVVGTIKVVFP